MKIVLAGGGNGSHVLAALWGARAGLEVRLLTRQPDRWSGEVGCTEHATSSEAVPWVPLPGVRRHRGRVRVVGWGDARSAVGDADLVVLSCPVHAHRELLARLLPHLPAGAAIGTLFAQGGFDWTALDVAAEAGVDLDAVTLFGLQHFPFLCKADRPGEHATLFGRFPEVRVAARGPGAERTAARLGALLERPVVRLSSFLPCTLAMSNQVLHPAIGWGLLRERGPAARFDEAPFFYPSCTLAGARAVIDLVDEIRLLARALEARTGVPVTREVVGDPGIRMLLALGDAISPVTQAAPWAQDLLVAGLFRLNRRLGGARLPTVPHPDGRGLVANLRSRFWEDDLPHGLCVLAGLAHLVGQPLPCVGRLIRDHQSWVGRRWLDPGASDLSLLDPASTSAPQRFGAFDIADLVSLLSGGMPARPASGGDGAPSAPPSPSSVGSSMLLAASRPGASSLGIFRPGRGST